MPAMSRNYLLFLEDMREACLRILRYKDGMSRDEFLADDKTYDATLRQMMIIGEAAKQVPLEVRALYPAVDWVGMGRFRDLAIHHYFGIDNRVVWNIVDAEVPELLAALNTNADG